MRTPIQNADLIGKPCETSIGRLTLAGTIRHSTGIPFDNMRILGSYAVVYLVEGSGRYLDDRGNHQQVYAGDLLMLYPDIAHAYGPGQGETWDEIFLVFDGPIFDLYRRQNLLDEERPVQRFAPVDYWFDRIESVATSAGKDSPLVCVCKLQMLIAELRDNQQATRLSNADRAWLARAMLLLEQQPSAHDFDLESVADKLDTSYIGFRKKFVRLAGISPGKFRSRAIMQLACEMLRRPGSSNRAIAQRLGFCDEFHFSRRFKQIIGFSPREFLLQMPSEPS